MEHDQCLQMSQHCGPDLAKVKGEWFNEELEGNEAGS